MNLKILPRSLEEIILSHILPIEYQKRHKKKMGPILHIFKNKHYTEYDEDFYLPVCRVRIGWLYTYSWICLKCGNYYENKHLYVGDYIECKCSWQV